MPLGLERQESVGATGDELLAEPGSFRDRGATVFYSGGRVFRGLTPAALLEWDRLSKAEFFVRLMRDGSIVATERATDQLPATVAAQWAAVLRHERIPFISYPYEWSFGMLKDAALLQLDLLDAALPEGMILKDASSYNVQWHGARPVFIDVGSFHALAPGQPWEGYRQFCQLYLYPLMLQAYKDVPFHPWLRGSLEGIESGHCAPLFSLRDSLRAGVLTHVKLQSKVQAKYASANTNVRDELRQAGFNEAFIATNVRRLRKLVAGLEWKQQRSEWSDYASNTTYDQRDQQSKEAFVRSAATSRRPRLVWDLGCNTGAYSRVAAEVADYVVAIDADHLAVERLYQALKAEGAKKIIPLVGNLADPSPNLGWRGAERKPLAERGKPDLVLALALIHHVVIGANVPLADFMDWICGLDADVVIEFVTRDDSMVRTLLRNRIDQYDDYTTEEFERQLKLRFDLVAREKLENGTRILYYGRNRSR